MLKYKVISGFFMVSALFLSTASQARNETLYLPIKDVLNSPEAQEKLDGSVKFYFASSGGGQVVKAGAVSNRKTNGFGKSDESACQTAMLSALIAFQETAKQMGANKVNNLVSYYKKNIYSNKSQYECHAGGFVTGVALRGDIAR